MKSLAGPIDLSFARLRLSQSEAAKLALEIANSISVGMSEVDAYHIAKSTFKKYGIRHHWHLSYIGLGAGTNKLRSVTALASSIFTKHRKLANNDLIMIDIAPMIEGYPSDYTVSKVIGENKEYSSQCDFTKEVAQKVFKMVADGKNNDDIFNDTKKLVAQDGKYTLGEVPIINMGHRLFRLPEFLQYLPEIRLPLLMLNPGPSFINGRWKKPLDGLWMVEPYILSEKRSTKYEIMFYKDEAGEIHNLNP